VTWKFSRLIVILYWQTLFKKSVPTIRSSPDLGQLRLPFMLFNLLHTLSLQLALQNDCAQVFLPSHRPSYCLFLDLEFGVLDFREPGAHPKLDFVAIDFPFI
jgi:hypothetical protein